jgi:hypothetical protein
MRGKHWKSAWIVLAAALLLSGTAGAQTGSTDDEDNYGDEEKRFAFAVGVGLVEPAGDVENYLMAALRIRVGDGGTANRGSESAQGGVKGYLEPEIGYWKLSDDRIEGSDLLVGVNLIGSVPLGPVESFFGAGAGVHFIDAALLDSTNLSDDSETKFGANAQFGIDLRVTRAVSVFGAGRFDLVQGSKDSVQSKVYLGLRAAF